MGRSFISSEEVEAWAAMATDRGTPAASAAARTAHRAASAAATTLHVHQCRPCSVTTPPSTSSSDRVLSVFRDDLDLDSDYQSLASSIDLLWKAV